MKIQIMVEKQKLFLKRLIHNELKKVFSDFDIKKIYFSEHHFSHAASTFYPSPFEQASILTMDGVGEWSTTTIGEGKKNNIVKNGDLESYLEKIIRKKSEEIKLGK